MHTFETKIQELKTSVLTEVARLTWEDKLQTGILDVPEKIIPGPEASLRCCIYKERAIINSRVKMAMGGDKTNPSVVEVLPIACDECPVTEMTVSASCRGCLATRCVHACPKDAISIVNHRASIDHSKCITCGKCVSACQYSAIVKNQRPCEKGCPAKAISMGPDKKASIDINECISCGNCVYQCPFGAIQDKSWIVDAIHMIQGGAHWGYKTYAVIAPSIAGQFAPATYGQVVAGIKQLGFSGVAEVALGADMVAETVGKICDGTLTTRPQPAGEFVPAPKIFREDCAIKWDSPTAEIHNHIRGLSPYPAAFSTLKDEAGRTFDVKILTSAVSDDAPGGLAPGETEVRGRRLFAGTSDGAIEILELQPSGKKRMDASSFLLGYHPARFLM